MRMKTVNASTSKPNGKPPHGDKFPGIDPAICFNEIYNVDRTDEAEVSEILIMHYKISKPLKKESSHISIRLIIGDLLCHAKCVT